ncbi:MAG: DinB family protein [Leptospiraceae bacterium]|nr:DinB family protein [Leptospiraceae bacterium]
MQTLPTIYECKTKEELYKQVLDVHQAIIDFYRAVPDEFFGSRAIPDGWTVRRNMKHVVSTNISFGFWVGLPSFILKLFGKPKTKQPTIEALDPTNRHGITDYGKYEKSNSANPKKKEMLLKLIESSAHKMNKHISKRTDEELDNLRGLFGGMTMRTFIYFLLKHNVHHTNIVKLRVEESI